MTGVTNKRPKVVLVKKDAVSQAGSFLDTLPAKPKESFSLRAAVEQLREPIRAALAKGYSYEEVAELLAKQGITISPSTLKNYAPSGTRQSKGEASAKGRKAAEESPAVTPSTEAVSPAPAKSAPKEKVTPIATPKTTSKAAAQPAKSRTPRTTAAKTAAAEPKTKTAAKTKASTSKQTTAAKTAKKPAVTKSRTRTTTKK
jgi:hypothetical protein